MLMNNNKKCVTLGNSHPCPFSTFPTYPIMHWGGMFCVRGVKSAFSGEAPFKYVAVFSDLSENILKTSPIREIINYK